jgi:rod shape-determining protein MreC
MSSLLKKHRIFLLVAFLLVLSLALLSWDVLSPHSTSLIEKASFKVLYLPLKTLSLFTHKLGFLIDKYFLLVDFKEENRLLREEAQRLRNDIRLLQVEARENERLRSLLGLKERVSSRAIVAEILGEDPSGWYKTLLIDKGRACGVREGDAALSPQGTVGRVLEVGENISKILLIVDKNSLIDAVIERTRTRGVVGGRGHVLCELKYVSIDEDVAIGDQVVCSGLGGVFPEGYPIGKVSRVIRKGGNLFQYIEVSPSVNFSQIEEILVATK